MKSSGDHAALQYVVMDLESFARFLPAVRYWRHCPTARACGPGSHDVEDPYLMPSIWVSLSVNEVVHQEIIMLQCLLRFYLVNSVP